jgi:hypothetical protein
MISLLLVLPGTVRTIPQPLALWQVAISLCYFASVRSHLLPIGMGEEMSVRIA